MNMYLKTQLMAVLIIAGLLTGISCAEKEVIAQPSTTEAKETEVLIESEEKVEEQVKIKGEKPRNEMDARVEDQFFHKNIYFEFDRANLNSEAEKQAREKAEFLAANPNISILIEGHCDQRGSGKYNLVLGQKRALAVKGFLVDLGVSDSRMSWVSLGEEKPVSTGQNEQAHKKNRRVEFRIQTPRNIGVSDKP